MKKAARTVIWGIISFLARLHLVSPKGVARLKYFEMMHRWPDFRNPKDLNEKINWLKFNGDTSEWSKLADKYAVREYVTGKGLGDILVELYGRWKDAEDIEWASLPDRFIMKTNNGSGDVLICEDKSRLDQRHASEYLSGLLRKEYGRLSAEPHYSHIKPLIIAEELLDSTTQPNSSKSLVDYKVWCFAGEPAYTMCCSNRRADSLELSVYDIEWNYHPDYVRETDHYKRPKTPIPRPNRYDEMLRIATVLSNGFPEVRIDLYEVNDRVYFGEMTFTSAGGFMNYYSEGFLRILGGMVKLDIKQKD